MYGTDNIMFVVARQAKEVYQCKNIKEKLHRTNAAIKCTFVGIRLYTVKYVRYR